MNSGIITNNPAGLNEDEHDIGSIDPEDVAVKAGMEQQYAPPASAPTGLLGLATAEGSADAETISNAERYYRSMFIGSSIAVAIQSMNKAIALMRKDPFEMEAYVNGNVTSWDLVGLYVKELVDIDDQLSKKIPLTEAQEERLKFVLWVGGLVAGVTEERASVLAGKPAQTQIG